MKKRFDVYISNIDLPQLRKEAVDAVWRAAMFPIALEGEYASDKNALQAMYDLVQNAEIFIGIYGHKYGYIPEKGTTWQDHVADGETSLIHYEYLLARERNLPILIFLVSDSFPVTIDQIDTDLERIKAFKDQLKKDHVISFFNSPQDLRAQVIQALYQKDVQELFVDKPSSDTEEKIAKTQSLDEVQITNAMFKALELFEAQRESKVLTTRSTQSLRTLRLEPSFTMPISMHPDFLSDIFVIMPFAEDFDGVYAIIKKVCLGLQQTVKRGDDFFSNRYIMDEVWFGLNNAKLVIADCTGRNPNVFYELGIAHVLGKSTILLTQNLQDLPFDVLGRRFIEYKNNVNGAQRLEAQLHETILRILNYPEQDEE